jgi:hypothetical protein
MFVSFSCVYLFFFFSFCLSFNVFSNYLHIIAVIVLTFCIYSGVSLFLYIICILEIIIISAKIKLSLCFVTHHKDRRHINPGIKLKDLT